MNIPVATNDSCNEGCSALTQYTPYSISWGSEGSLHSWCITDHEVLRPLALHHHHHLLLLLAANVAAAHPALH